MSPVIEFLDGGEPRRCDLRPADDGWTASVDGSDPLAALTRDGVEVTVVADGRRRTAWVARRDGERLVFLDGVVHVFRLPGDEDEAEEAAAGGPRVFAEMPGKVVKLLVAEGDAVEAGQPLLIVEAMKMETELRASTAGRVVALPVAAGDTVAEGDLLADVAPDGEEEPA